MALRNIRVENSWVLFMGPRLLPDMKSWKEACLLDQEKKEDLDISDSRKSFLAVYQFVYYLFNHFLEGRDCGLYFIVFRNCKCIFCADKDIKELSNGNISPVPYVFDLKTIAIIDSVT